MQKKPDAKAVEIDFDGIEQRMEYIATCCR